MIAIGCAAVIAALALIPVFAAKNRKRELEYYKHLDEELYYDPYGDV